MKKIPTLFERVFDENGHVVKVTETVTQGCEAVFEGRTTPTVKVDGQCCAIINGQLYLRYDVKPGILQPKNAIPCQPAPDKITGYWPHWVPYDPTNPAHKWYGEAYKYTCEVMGRQHDATYEAIGPHFTGNMYGLSRDMIVEHGTDDIEGLDLSYEGIKEYLKNHLIEGIVFWKDGEPLCKIKRRDFGFPWGPGMDEQEKENVTVTLDGTEKGGDN